MTQQVTIEIYSDNYTSAQTYHIRADLSKEQFLFIASNLLGYNNYWRLCYFGAAEPKWIEQQNLNSWQGNEWWVGEVTKHIKKDTKITKISYRPGVTDNLASTVKKMIEQQFNYKFNKFVYSTRMFFGECNYKHNDLIEIAQSGSTNSTWHVQQLPPLNGNNSTHTATINLEGIAKYNKQNGLGLSSEAISVIKNYFVVNNRNPTDIELESIAQTWSEHCKHTIFSSPIDEIKDGLYKTYIKAATAKIMAVKPDFCVSVFSDNAGAISFTEDFFIAAKVETHNSPSALEPFGGAITGILGVNRDIIGFGQGAKPIANTYGFCFPDPNKEYKLFRDPECTKPVLTPQEIIEGVIAGVEAGGNCSGIPTPQGFVYYHERFIAKPLVFVGTIGLIPREISGKPSHIKKPQDGDYIVIIGGHTGKDGIHGANFSSEALNSTSATSAVQIGDPITQKKLSDAIIKEARGLGLYNAITDNGAGGLSSSIGEMGESGFTVELEKVPLKYQGMMPWEIWVSESQERMTLAVPPAKYQELCSIMHKHDVDICIIGTFNSSGIAKVTYNSDIILHLDTKFLHDGNPKTQLHTEEICTTDKFPLTNSINFSDRNFITRQYDHEVQGNSVLKPIQGNVTSDATVIRPVLLLNKGIALSQGLGLLLDDKCDPYIMAAQAIDTAIRNLVVVGADPDKVALLDNFCWSNSTDSKRLWQLKRTAESCYDYAVAYGAPFISGKDSMFNDFKGYDYAGNFVHLTDPPTLLISAIGVVDNIEQCVSLDPKFAGDLIYLLGSNDCYEVDANKSLHLYRQVHTAIKSNLISSAISVNWGGLKQAIVKTEQSSLLKMKFYNQNLLSDEEYPSRIIITINPTSQRALESIISDLELIGVME